MSEKHRDPRRHHVWSPEPSPIAIRVFTRRTTRHFYQMNATGAESDAGHFARMVDEQVHDCPQDPLIIAINGYETWLGEILRPCIKDYWNEISELDREVQYANTMQFPSRRGHKSAQYWSFILEHLNMPQVYYWSVDMDPPNWEEDGLPSIEKFRFRTGVWMSAQGACRYNERVPVVIIFTQPTDLAEYIVKDLLFDYLQKDEDFDRPREDEEGICWIFSRLYSLLTDWQNIVNDMMARLEASETNSKSRVLPVKVRTRQMHEQISLLYNLKEYLRFQVRAFKKLQKLQKTVAADDQNKLLWDDMEDAVDDLHQFDTTLDGVKERLNNLIELEFNITNATQSENSQFLSSVATLFLPASFLSSLWGITECTWPMMWLLWTMIPVLALSILFTVGFPLVRKRMQDRWHAYEQSKILHTSPEDYTMLGDELPDDVDAPSHRPSTAKRGARRTRRANRDSEVRQRDAIAARDSLRGRSDSRAGDR